MTNLDDHLRCKIHDAIHHDGPQSIQSLAVTVGIRQTSEIVRLVNHEWFERSGHTVRIAYTTGRTKHKDLK